jgi:hypothetical protein
LLTFSWNFPLFKRWSSLHCFSRIFQPLYKECFLLYNSFPDLYSITDMTNTTFHNIHFSHLWSCHFALTHRSKQSGYKKDI